MKRFYRIAAIAVLATFTLPATKALAASDAECGNYLCMPQGYADSACDEPKEAMRDRVRHGKSPLPPFHECTAEETSEKDKVTTNQGNATRYGGEYHKNETCRKNDFDEWEPNGCNGRNYWYVEMTDSNGSEIGMQDGEGKVVGNTKYIKK